jgi:hypothetical protein
LRRRRWRLPAGAQQCRYQQRYQHHSYTHSARLPIGKSPEIISIELSINAKEIIMAQNKDKTQQGKKDVPDQGGSGSVQQQGSDGSRQSGFLHSSPDANVFPAGSPQADNSTRGGGGDSAAGTPDEGRLGGSGGTSAPGTTGNDPDR